MELELISLTDPCKHQGIQIVLPVLLDLISLTDPGKHQGSKLYIKQLVLVV